MVPILVLLTCVGFLLVEALWSRHRRGLPEAAATAARSVGPARRVAEVGPPAAVFFHPGHSWVGIQPGGLVTVGPSRFARHFAGRLARVELPREGTLLRQGETAWTLVSGKRRRLSQAMPVAGEVVDVNPNPLLCAPREPQSHEAAWLLRVRPTRLGESLRNLIPSGLVATWEDATRSKVTAGLAPDLRALAYDGGEWVADFGDLLQETVWEALRSELFPTGEINPGGPNGPARA